MFLERKNIKRLSLILIVIVLGVSFWRQLIYQEEEVFQKRVLEAKLDNEEEYFAIIEIPKIDLKKELYAIGDIRNDVNKNLLVHEISEFRKDGASMIVIAGHSGTSKVAYFRNLYRLEVGDEVKLYYGGNCYQYLVREIESQEKTGKLYLKNYQGLGVIVLITCTKNDDKHQTIYYAEIDKKCKINEVLE